jgi:hypothetical protein
MAPITHYHILSESCVPVGSPSSHLQALSSSSTVINLQSTPNNGYASQLQFDPLNKYFNGTTTATTAATENIKVRKADQWCTIGGKHARMWLKVCKFLLGEEEKEEDDSIAAKNTDSAEDDDASLPPSLPLHPVPVKKLQGTPFWTVFNRTKAPDELVVPFLYSLSSTTSDVRIGRSTYVDWEGEAKNPKTLTFEECVDSKEDGVLFGRKVKEAVDEEQFWKLVDGANAD